MKQIQLIGRSNEEIEKAQLESHKKVFEHLHSIKEGDVYWTDFDEIQNDLMDAAGYMSKEVNYMSKEIEVTFKGNLFPSNQLVGKGKNELEAICDACKNFVNDPSKYNMHSIKYVK
jgi:hypothetical protein